MGGKVDSSDVATTAGANLVSNLSDMNKEDNKLLKESVEQIPLIKLNTRAYVLELIPKLKAILLLTGANPKTSTRFSNAIVILEGVATRPPRRYHMGRVNLEFTRCMQALTKAVNGCSTLKSYTFLQTFVATLSNITLLKEHMMIPDKLMKMLQANAGDFE